MTKFTNIIACLIAAACFGAFAKGDWDQEIVRNSMLWVYWIPCAWCALAAIVNLRNKG